MAAFQFHFMALANDVIDRHDPSNEMCCELYPKKTKVRLYLPCMEQQKMFYTIFTINKTKRLSFKSGYVVHVENGKMHHQF